MEKVTLDDLSREYTKLVRQKSTVDGREVEHVFYVAGGFGTDEASDSGIAGGGIAIPLGAYYNDGDRVRFHPNPAVMTMLGIPFFVIGACVARRMLKLLERSA